MKRLIFFFTIAVAVACNVQAARVSEMAARQVANQFFSAQSTRLAAPATQSALRLAYTAENDRFYVYDRGTRGGFVEREGMVVRLHAASVLFFDDESQQEIFIPLSQIKDWWFTSSHSKRGLELEDCELDDELTIVIPGWLAKKEGMV